MHKRFIRSTREAMNFPRRDVFARPGFTAQKNRRLGWSDLFDIAQNILKRGTLANDLPKVEGTVDFAIEISCVLLQLSSEPAIFSQEMESLDGLGEGASNLLGIPGLGDVPVDHSLIDRLNQYIHIRKCSQNDAYGIRSDFLRFGQQLKPCHLGHALIRHNDGEILLCQRLQSLRPIVDRLNLKRSAKVYTRTAGAITAW